VCAFLSPKIDRPKTLPFLTSMRVEEITIGTGAKDFQRCVPKQIFWLFPLKPRSHLSIFVPALGVAYQFLQALFALRLGVPPRYWPCSAAPSAMCWTVPRQSQGGTPSSTWRWVPRPSLNDSGRNPRRPLAKETFPRPAFGESYACRGHRKNPARECAWDRNLKAFVEFPMFHRSRREVACHPIPAQVQRPHNRRLWHRTFRQLLNLPRPLRTIPAGRSSGATTYPRAPAAPALAVKTALHRKSMRESPRAGRLFRDSARTECCDSPRPRSKAWNDRPTPDRPQSSALLRPSTTGPARPVGVRVPFFSFFGQMILLVSTGSARPVCFAVCANTECPARSPAIC